MNMRVWVLVAVLGVGGVMAAQGTAPPVAVATPLPAGIQVEAKPALWEVKGVHGKVYLFGSIHVMRKEVHWETATVKDAFKASDVFYFEIADVGPDAMQAMQQVMMTMGMDVEHPLSTKITPGDVTLLDAAVKKMGLPGEVALEPMQPWPVYLMLAVLPAMQAGYDTALGIDQILQGEAKALQKSVKGFETAEEQMHYLADFPVDQQVAMLHEELVDLPKSVAETDDAVGYWTHGEVEKIGAQDNDEMKTKYPALYDKLLVKRNERFADALAGMLKDPATGTVFCTIGAGHLAGPDSVIKMLTAKGFVVTRVE